MKENEIRLFDSHCHLDDKSFDSDIDDVIERMNTYHVARAMIVGIDLKSSQKAVKLANTYSQCFASVGVHPHDAKRCTDDGLKKLEALAKDPKVRAWGETGLDFNRMFSPADIQEKWFLRQMNIANEIGLPLIFHERDSQGRFLELLKSNFNARNGGVVHCFSGNKTELAAYLDLGLYIGITGILTIHSRGSDLRELVHYIPPDKLLIETDAPYLTPAPEKNRHRRNEPAFVKSVFHKLAGIRGFDEKLLSKTIWNNTCRLFGIDTDMQ